MNRFFELGEGTLGRLAEELLSNPRIASAFAQALTKAMEAKGTVDRNMQTVLKLLNVPSRSDVTKLATKLEAIQGNLMNLSLKVDRALGLHRLRQRLRERGRDARIGQELFGESSERALAQLEEAVHDRPSPSADTRRGV